MRLPNVRLCHALHVPTGVVDDSWYTAEAGEVGRCWRDGHNRQFCVEGDLPKNLVGDRRLCGAWQPDHRHTGLEIGKRLAYALFLKDRACTTEEGATVRRTDTEHKRRGRGDKCYVKAVI